MSTPKIVEVWDVVFRKLRDLYGEAVARSWLSHIAPEKFENGILHLSVPSAFLRDWIINNYHDKMLEFFSAEDPAITEIKFEVRANGEGGKQLQSTTDSKNPSDGLDDAPSVLGVPLDPELTFDNFVVGKPNEFAYAAAQRVAEAETGAAYNPLFLYGGVGLGKTHLMHAIAWRIKSNFPNKKVAYMSAEKFMYQFIRSVRFKNTVSFKEQFRSVDVLMIDDIQFICGKDSTQEEFFHTFNSLIDNNRQVIISADKSPSDLDDMEERLKSRLGWGLVADIHPTTYELRLGILQARAAMANVQVPDKVLEFLAHRITTNIRELEGALNRIVASAMLVGRDISIESAQEVLADLLRTSDRSVTVEEIQKKVAAHYLIKFSDMMSARRTKQITIPRQVAMYLSKKLTKLSLPDIGSKFGGKDHTTVLHACRKIESEIKTNASLSEDIRLLTGILEQ